MEGLRSEVSQKIKKAIQAKLLELGVTIDEELPDYVMVLIVNKKSKEQMEEDLSLFLQGKTSIFVEWLLEILGRLQTMSMQTKAKPAKASHRSTKQDVPAQRNTRKQSPSSDQLESRKRRRSDCAEPASVAGLQPEPHADGTAGPASAEPASMAGLQQEPRADGTVGPASPVHTGPTPAPPTNPQTPAAGEMQQRPTGLRPPDGSPDPPGRQRSTSRDSSETRRSNSRESSKSRSNSRESSKPRSRSRDSSESRRSKSRDSSESRRSKSRDSSESRRSKSRDSTSRDPEDSRRSPDGTRECRSHDRESGPAGRRHPRISFPSARDKRDTGRASAGSEADPAAVDERCRRVPPLHGASPTPPGGRVINLRQESSFPLSGRPSDQQTAGARRGPQSAVSAVRRRPPAEASDAEDPEEEEEEGRSRGAVASTVRVTDRPRPPLHLLPRPAILVKAMRDAQRSTGAAGPGTRRQDNTDGANPAPTAAAAGKKTRPYVGDLRAKLAAARRLETATPAAPTVAVRSSPRRRAEGRQHR